MIRCAGAGVAAPARYLSQMALRRHLARFFSGGLAGAAARLAFRYIRKLLALLLAVCAHLRDDLGKSLNVRRVDGCQGPQRTAGGDHLVGRVRAAGHARVLHAQHAEAMPHARFAGGDTMSGRLDNPVVTPAFTGFRHIGLQQYPRLQQPMGRALALSYQRFKLLPFLNAQPHNIPLYRNLLRSHHCLRPMPCR
jgi:hypothetical protein